MKTPCKSARASDEAQDRLMLYKVTPYQENEVPWFVIVVIVLMLIGLGWVMWTTRW